MFLKLREAFLLIVFFLASCIPKQSSQEYVDGCLIKNCYCTDDDDDQAKVSVLCDRSLFKDQKYLFIISNNSRKVINELKITKFENLVIDFSNQQAIHIDKLLIINNHVRSISFDGIQNTTELEIKSNFFESFHPNALRKLASTLKKVYFYKNNFKIKNDTNEGNNLNPLYQSVKYLISLEILMFEMSRLQNFEENFLFGLKNLTILSLRSNLLTKLNPSLFRGLKKLEKIILSFNNFGPTFISHALYPLKDTLKVLEMSNASLKKFHFDHFYTTLETLDLSNNYLEDTMMYIFISLPNIETINLANNQLNQARSLAYNSKLKTLILSHNSLKWFDVTRMLTNLRSLEYALLDDNTISVMPYLKGLVNLKGLDVSRQRNTDIFVVRSRNLDRDPEWVNQLKVSIYQHETTRMALHEQAFCSKYSRGTGVKYLEVSLNSLTNFGDGDETYNEASVCALANLPADSGVVQVKIDDTEASNEFVVDRSFSKLCNCQMIDYLAKFRVNVLECYLKEANMCNSTSSFNFDCNKVKRLSQFTCDAPNLLN